MGENRLRIAILSVHSCPVGTLGTRDTGGMSVYIREVAKELCRLGHTVDVYTRVHDPADPQVIDLGECARLIHIPAGQELDINKLALYSYLPDFTCALERFRQENDLHYDVVFSHYWLSGWVGQYLKMWWGVPHVVMFHTLGVIKNGVGIGTDEPELRTVTERETVRESQRIIASTEHERDEIVRHYGVAPEKIGIVPCGVNTALFRPMDRQAARRELGWSDGKTLLFVGRIDPLKGIESLIEAVALLKDKNARLVVVGGDEENNEEVQRLRHMADGLGLGGRSTFRGLVKHDKLPRYYSAADVTVVPSYYESFGLVALESLACGTPVVATDVGDMSRIIRPGETGYVVADNRPEELAARIDRLLDGEGIKSPQLISQSVSNYNWANIAVTVSDELYRVTSDSASPVA